MPRGPRLDAPGCVHHVMVRGIERRTIFLDDLDRLEFLDRLSSILPESSASCFAFALIPNHAHLVVQTGPVPLSRTMARLNCGYAQRFNRRHDRCGHLFQNRFKSRLVNDEADLMNLICYVHLNPLRAGCVASPAELPSFPWCGHGALVGSSAPLPFHSASAALALFGDEPIQARTRLRAWMQRAEDGAGELGPQPEEAPEREPHAAGNARPGGSGRGVDLSGLIERVCERLAVAPRDLARGRRSRDVAAARAAVAYLAVVRHGMSGGRVAAALGVSPSAISQSLDRGREIVTGWGLAARQ